MESPIPPDPYAALGVSSNAQPNEIKTAYRKLVLKCHPDKITDETAKQKAVDEFHKVQQAYEILGDEEKRGRYDALVRLAELRRQKMEMHMSASQGSMRTSAYDTRTAAPPASFTTRGPPPRAFATNERRPSHYSDEEQPRASARKMPNDYNFVRRGTFDREREKERDSDRVKRDEDRRRAERRRDTEREADRSSKYASASKDEEFAKYEESRKRRDNEEKSRKSPPRKDPADDHTTRQYEEAQKYMASQRPSYNRSTSSRNLQYNHVRRSAADSRDRRPGRDGSPRDSRRAPEIVDPSRPSTLKPQYSDPAGMAGAVPRSRDKPEPHRSYTTQTDFDRRRDGAEPAPFPFSRSSTMPMPPSSSSSRKPALSSLRTTDIPDSGYSSPATPEREYAPPPPGPPPSSKTKQYHYPDTTQDYRTIYRQPTSASTSTSARRVSPPAKERSSNSSAKTANMMANLASSRAMPVRSATFATYPEPSSSSSRASPRMSRSPERVSSRDDRDRGRRDRYREEPPRGKLYGEVDAGRDPRSRTSYAPEDVSFTRRYGRDDVSYASGTVRDSRGSDYDRAPPSLSRRGTAVY